VNYQCGEKTGLVKNKLDLRPHPKKFDIPKLSTAKKAI